MAHLVGCCVYDVCCVLCFALQPTTRDDCNFFSGHNFFQFLTDPPHVLPQSPLLFNTPPIVDADFRLVFVSLHQTAAI